MRGKIIIKKSYINKGWYTKFHGESGRLYYAELIPSSGKELKDMPFECKIYECTTEGDDNSGVEWDRALYLNKDAGVAIEDLKKCVECFLGYPVDMVIG